MNREPVVPWYLSPVQHFFEFFVFAAASCYLFNYSFRKVWKESSLQRQLASKIPNSPKTLFEIGLALACIASFIFIGYTKYLRGDMFVLLQLCHFNLLLLTLILLFPKRNQTQQLLFNIFVWGIWGTSMALIQPDLRSWNGPFEVGMFFFEHLVLLFAPVILVLTGKFIIWPNDFAVGVLSFAFYMGLSFILMSPLSILAGQNINYLLNPPPGPMEILGSFYRLIGTPICYLVSVAVRYTFTELCIFIVGTAQTRFGSTLLLKKAC